ncbi:MAG: carboxypeptidase-like regulatory domain-containing protein, partial [Verrucomicrobia bacterium]|nr:carboxypeptidase-like regulatory domain-containing protein [Verrucomicrobiota bacterium]
YLTQTLPVQGADTGPQPWERVVRLKRAGDQLGVVLDYAGQPVPEFISGRVVDDQTGEPIVDFVVQSSVPNPTKHNDVSWSHYMMGNKQRPGQYGLSRPTPQRMWRILAAGYVPLVLTEQSVPTTSSPSGMEIRLKRGGALQGVVLDDGGRPVAGARVLLATVQRVFLMDGKFQYGPFKGSSTTTDGAGRFALRGEGGTSEKVVIVSPDSHLVWPAVQSEPGQELNITLPKPGTLIVRYDIPGDALDAQFQLGLTTTNKEMPLWQNISFSQSLTVTNQGQTVLTNLTPGTYKFRRWKSADREHGAEIESQTVSVEAGQTQQVEIVRTNGQRVRGQVIGLDQAQASGGYVFVRSAAATGQPWPQRSRNYSKEFECPSFDVSKFGADGTFQTAMLKPGTYTVVANVYPPKNPAPGMPYRNDNPDYVGVAKVTVTAEAMPPVTIHLAPAIFVDIAGSGVDDESGAPIPDLMIQSGKINPDEDGGIIWEQGFQGAAEGGRFSLWNERDGAAFRFLASGYLPQVFTRNEIIASRHTANLQVRLKRGGELHGVVLDHAGRPVADGTVYLAPLDLGYVRLGQVMSSSSSEGSITNWAHSFATTDAAGRFSLRGVGGNQTRVVAVSADGQLVQPLQVSGLGQELKITLPKPASLIVHYEIPGDVSEAYVGLTLRTNELEMPLWKYVMLKPAAKVQNGGKVVLTNLTPGTYDFSRSRYCGTTNGFYAFMFGDPSKLVQSDLQTIVLEPGQTEELSLVRSVGQRVQGRVTGLESITNTAASYLYVASATAIRSPLDFTTQLEPCFDAVRLGKDGLFQTALLQPGTYTLVAEVYVLGELPQPYPVGDDEPQYGGMLRMRPSSLAYVGSAGVTVTAAAAPAPVKIELLPWKPTTK